MSTERRSRRSRVPDFLGGKLFGGSRRTAREFVTIVALVFALVAVLVLQAWQRIEIVETMRENRRLEGHLARLGDLVICRETALQQRTSRDCIVERAGAELELRLPDFGEVVFVPDYGRCCADLRNRPRARGSLEGGAP